jgi:hypothetical protein
MVESLAVFTVFAVVGFVSGRLERFARVHKKSKEEKS